MICILNNVKLNQKVERKSGLKLEQKLTIYPKWPVEKQRIMVSFHVISVQWAPIKLSVFTKCIFCCNFFEYFSFYFTIKCILQPYLHSLYNFKIRNILLNVAQYWVHISTHNIYSISPRRYQKGTATTINKTLFKTYTVLHVTITGQVFKVCSDQLSDYIMLCVVHMLITNGELLGADRVK